MLDREQAQKKVTISASRLLSLNLGNNESQLEREVPETRIEVGYGERTARPQPRVTVARCHGCASLRKRRGHV